MSEPELSLSAPRTSLDPVSSVLMEGIASLRDELNGSGRRLGDLLLHCPFPLCLRLRPPYLLQSLLSVSPPLSRFTLILILQRRKVDLNESNSPLIGPFTSSLIPCNASLTLLPVDLSETHIRWSLSYLEP